MLQASVAANEGGKGIVIRSPYTDVLVLLLHHRSKIVAKEIFFLTGRMGTHVEMKRYIPVHILFSILTQAQISFKVTAHFILTLY